MLVNLMVWVPLKKLYTSDCCWWSKHCTCNCNCYPSPHTRATYTPLIYNDQQSCFSSWTNALSWGLQLRRMYSKFFRQMCKPGCQFLWPKANPPSHLTPQGCLKHSKQLLTSPSALLLLNPKIPAKGKGELLKSICVFIFNLLPFLPQWTEEWLCLPPPRPGRPEAKAGSAAICSLPPAPPPNNSPSFHYVTKHSSASNTWNRSCFPQDLATSGLFRKSHLPPRNPLHGSGASPPPPHPRRTRVTWLRKWCRQQRRQGCRQTSCYHLLEQGHPKRKRHYKEMGQKQKFPFALMKVKNLLLPLCMPWEGSRVLTFEVC